MCVRSGLSVDLALLVHTITPRSLYSEDMTQTPDTRPSVKAPPELLDEIREDLRHEGMPRCDRWFPDLPEGSPVVKVDRILVLSSPDPKAVGKVGTLRSFDGFACVDLHDGTPVRPLVQEVALLPEQVKV